MLDIQHPEVLQYLLNFQTIDTNAIFLDNKTVCQHGRPSVCGWPRLPSTRRTHNAHPWRDPVATRLQAAKYCHVDHPPRNLKRGFTLEGGQVREDDKTAIMSREGGGCRPSAPCWLPLTFSFFFLLLPSSSFSAPLLVTWSSSSLKLDPQGPFTASTSRTRCASALASRSSLSGPRPTSKSTCFRRAPYCAVVHAGGCWQPASASTHVFVDRVQAQG